MFEELMNAHLTDLRTTETLIEHRMEWEQITRIERLERALKSARGKMNFLLTLSVRMN